MKTDMNPQREPVSAAAQVSPAPAVVQATGPLGVSGCKAHATGNDAEPRLPVFDV